MSEQPDNDNELLPRLLEDVWCQLQPVLDTLYITGVGPDEPLTIKLQDLVRDFITPEDQPDEPLVKKARRPSLPAHAMMCTRLREYLTARVVALRDAAEEKTGRELLEFYITSMTHYLRSSRAAIFHPLDECLQYKHVHCDVPYLAQTIWSEQWTELKQPQFVLAALTLVRQDRQGERVLETSLLRNAIYHALQGRSHRQFLEQFVQDATTFYHAEGSRFLEWNPRAVYLDQVEKWLKEEEGRWRRYVTISYTNLGVATLQARCADALLSAHMSVFWLEFPALLDADREQDLGRMYRLCSHVQSHRDSQAGPDAAPVNGLDRLVELFEQYVTERGLEAVKSVSSAVLSADGQDAKLYVDTILGVHRKYYNLVLQAFSNNRRFVEALDKACVKFINRNELTRLAKNNQKTPELLARYSDALLKKGSKDNMAGNQLEGALCDVAVLLKYIDNKEVFHKFYSSLLGRRLLFDLSVSRDAESLMMSKLKGSRGFDFTYSMERMLHSVGASRELNTSFRDSLSSDSTPLGLDFEINVLPVNTWCFCVPRGSGVIIPSELERCYIAFNRFYKTTHQGRKLQWCYNLCRGELVTNFTGERYTLQASTYQIAVLMMFNTETSYTVQEIASTSSIETQVLQQVLAILVKAKLLLLLPAESGAGGSELAPGRRLALNQSFQRPRLRINLNSQLKCESKI